MFNKFNKNDFIVKRRKYLKVQNQQSWFYYHGGYYLKLIK